MFFALLRRMLLAAIAVAGVMSSALAADQTALPAGGKYHDCHGYVRHVSTTNIRVHCIDGRPADLSFLYIPKYASLTSGKSMQTKDLLPDTPVHVIFTQSLGVRKAYKIYVADPNGEGKYGFKS